MNSFDVLIVGGGHGGAQAAIALRQLGFTGSIGLCGAEPDLPYERPPLSKDYLAGEKDFERLLIRPAAFWAERAVTMRLGRAVVAVDPALKKATLEDGEAIGYGALIWAAGGTARTLPGGGHVVRGRADVDRILALLPAARRVRIVGGGYIGLEAAAVLATLGKQVTLVEAADRLLARVAGAPLSDFYAAEHRARGVDLRLGAAADAADAADAATADLVILGIGIDPVWAPLRAAGAAGEDGVHVDETCRTSLPDIYAIGDCAAHVSRFAGGARLRIESVQNAADQAVVAARSILGRPEPYAAIPWFWSNQYDLKLQTVGLHHGHDALVLRGDQATRSFALAYLRAGRLIAMDCVNRVKDYVQARKLIESGARPDPIRLADPAVPLKEL
jgi:3-phenylpropionate/trans-cinnamate dioxygenase ferredoxin reductase component